MPKKKVAPKSETKTEPIVMSNRERTQKIDFVVHVFGGKDAFTYANVETWKDSEIIYAYERAESYLQRHGVVDYEDLM